MGQETDKGRFLEYELDEMAAGRWPNGHRITKDIFESDYGDHWKRAAEQLRALEKALAMQQTTSENLRKHAADMEKSFARKAQYLRVYEHYQGKLESALEELTSDLRRADRGSVQTG